MILSTTPDVPGHTVVRCFGLVRGNTIRSRALGRDIMAVMRSIVGGEVTEYTKMMGEAREQAVDRMIEDAEALGANAIIGMRFQTAYVMSGAAEILCYGTACFIEVD
jgi:uncharacterized protein YbjQ (UPF0145 family)